MMQRRLPFYLFIACFSFSHIPLKAQKNWVYNAQANMGCHFNFTYGKGHRFPGIKIFAGFNIMGVGKKHLLVNYGPSVSIYTKTIGANLNPLVGDIQIDFCNSISFGGGWGNDLPYMKFFRTVHTGDYYNVATSKKNLLFLTSNFILNNHKRNQVVGSITGSFTNFSFNYYNDGAFPFTILPLADNFDRYWTGGLSAFIHTRNNFNRAEISFDQFTGYTPLAYELGNLIGINVPLYNDAEEPKDKRTTLASTFNTSTYQVKIFTDKNYAFDIGAIGSLTNKSKGFHFGIQDIIHIKMKLPLHPNNDMTRIFLGGSYINMQHVKIQ